MYVCICSSVTDRQIREAVASGSATLEDLQMDLGVAIRCGRCRSCAQDILDEALCAAGAPPFASVPAPAFA